MKKLIVTKEYPKGVVVEVENTEEQTSPELQIMGLKQQLEDSDYKALKYAEGWITEEEYAPIKAERQTLRDRINELEETILK